MNPLDMASGTYGRLRWLVSLSDSTRISVDLTGGLEKDLWPANQTLALFLVDAFCSRTMGPMLPKLFVLLMVTQWNAVAGGCLGPAEQMLFLGEKQSRRGGHKVVIKPVADNLLPGGALRTFEI